MKHDKKVYKRFLLLEIFSKAAVDILLFYTYCMFAEDELMRKDEKKTNKKSKIKHFEEQCFGINGHFAKIKKGKLPP